MSIVYKISICSSKVSAMPQSTSGHGHGHNNTAPHVGPHSHALAVPSQGPAVVQGHVHPPAPMPSATGQQQFQRLKVSVHHHIYENMRTRINQNSCSSQVHKGKKRMPLKLHCVCMLKGQSEEYVL